jgi:anti-anti-sigma factor
MDQSPHMQLEALDPRTLAVRVQCRGEAPLGILARLSSLVMVASDCGVPSIRFGLPGTAARVVREVAREIAARNPIVSIDEDASPEAPEEELGLRILGHDLSFLCARDEHNGDRYSIYLAAIEENVERSARCAYMIAGVLGFSSGTSFEIRFSIYELLHNAVEHGLAEDSREWVQVELEKQGEKLVISIIDKGAAFDPSGDAAFDLGAYIAERKRRGLGLVMTRRIAEQLHYEREPGRNKVIFQKSIDSSRTAERAGKESLMAQFEATEPRPRADGSHVIRLSGDLDTKGALGMERLLAELLEKKMTRVTLDFEKVPFISSAGVGILLGIVSSLRDSGGEVVFTRISPKVRSVFRLLNLEDYFSIKESIESSV